jgi:hypothetical protein
LYTKVRQLGGFREAVAEQAFKTNPKLGQLCIEDRHTYEKHCFKYEKMQSNFDSSIGVSVERLDPTLLKAVHIVDVV